MTLHTIYFTREFTDGLLKGIQQRDSITTAFPEQWRTGTVFKKRFVSSYKIVDASFQNYSR